MLHICERIENISELEKLIWSAYQSATAIRSEIEKESPSLLRINELSQQVHLDLLKAKYFEFQIEQRIIHSTD